MIKCIGTSMRRRQAGNRCAPGDRSGRAEERRGDYAIAHGAMVGAVVAAHQRGLSVDLAIAGLTRALLAAGSEGEASLSEAIRGLSDGAADGVSLIGGDAQGARRWVLAILHGQSGAGARLRDGEDPRREEGGIVSRWMWIGRTPSAPMRKAQSRRTT
jgi:hypothetical protein